MSYLKCGLCDKEEDGAGLCNECLSGEPYERNQALTKAIVQTRVWVGDGEFDPDSFTKALEASGYTLVRL